MSQHSNSMDDEKANTNKQSDRQFQVRQSTKIVLKTNSNNLIIDPKILSGGRYGYFPHLPPLSIFGSIIIEF